MSQEIEANESPEPDAGPVDDDLLEAQADAAEDFLNGLLDVLDMDGEAEADIEDDDSIYVELHGPSMGVLIGRHGATLEALQDLTRAAVQHQTSSRAVLSLDIEGYRERRASQLERVAKRTAATVRETGEPVHLEPMNASERKVIHNVLAGSPGVRTASEGEGPDRHLVIHPA